MSETGSLFLSRPWSPGPHIIYGPNNRKLQTEAPMKITFFAPLPSSVILPIDAQPQTCIQKYILSYSHIAVWESLSILCPRERVCVCVTRVPSSLSSIQVCVCVCVCVRVTRVHSSLSFPFSTQTSQALTDDPQGWILSCPSPLALSQAHAPTCCYLQQEGRWMKYPRPGQ